MGSPQRRQLGGRRSARTSKARMSTTQSMAQGATSQLDVITILPSAGTAPALTPDEGLLALPPPPARMAA